jgi:predicted dehydrogenase
MPVRIGVIGVGALGHHHARILRDVPDATMVGFHDVNRDRAAKVASELGIQPFASLDQLLDAVDAVTVVVPTPAHFAVASKALERGKHVLVEKPIAATLDEADASSDSTGRFGALFRTSTSRVSSRAIASRRSIRAGRMSPSCST